MKNRFLCFSSACLTYGPIWFVNLDTSYASYVKLSAYRCGEFSVTLDWFYGMLSNFLTFLSVFRQLYHYSSLAYKERQRWAMIIGISF